MNQHPEFKSDQFPNHGNWTKEQLKLAFYFYCQTPFGKFDSRNKNVIQLASLIGRTPGALAMKLVNFASLDPSIVESGRSGLSNASSLDREIWKDFHADWERLAIECEQLMLIIQNRQGKLPTDAESAVPSDFESIEYVGETRAAVVQQRIKQSFFRSAILSSYRNRCCISGVSEPKLLIASHIVPWSEDRNNRLNPRNGLCLSAIHDKAFDKHLITLSEDFRLILSSQLKATKDVFLRDVFFSSEGRKIELPERFFPDADLIKRHREVTLL